MQSGYFLHLRQRAHALHEFMILLELALLFHPDFISSGFKVQTTTLTGNISTPSDYNCTCVR